jgi:hypothetical protein
LLGSSVRQWSPANTFGHIELDLSRFFRRLRTNADALERQYGAGAGTKKLK